MTPAGIEGGENQLDLAYPLSQWVGKGITLLQQSTVSLHKIKLAYVSLHLLTAGSICT